MADYIFPGQCITLGFRYRLLLRATWPIILPVASHLYIAIIFCIICLMSKCIAMCRSAGMRAQGREGHTGPLEVVSTRSPLIRPLIDALFLGVPFYLLVSFVLCPTVSKSIFGTWDCTEYELDGVTGEVRTFLNADPQIVCSGNDHPEEYDEIKNIASTALADWGTTHLFACPLS